MPNNQIDKVINVIKPFVQIKKGINPYQNQKVPDYMFKLVKDDSAYQEFIADPVESFKREGIQPEKIDVEMFSGLAKTLRDRMRGVDSVIDKIAASISQKETSEGAQANFDHSSSWLMNKEGYNVLYERGTSESKSTGESVTTDRGFGGSGIGIRPEEIIRHEINLLFFPTQPIVTPALLDKIKDNLSRG